MSQTNIQNLSCYLRLQNFKNYPVTVLKYKITIPGAPQLYKDIDLTEKKVLHPERHLCFEKQGPTTSCNTPRQRRAGEKLAQN